MTEETPNTKNPVILFIHGGAWHVGDKHYARFPAMALSETGGYTVVATSYRQSTISDEQLESILLITMSVMLLIAITSRTITQMMVILILTVLVVAFFLVLWYAVPREKIRHPDHVLDVARALRWTVDHCAEYHGDVNRIYVVGHSAGGHLATLISTNRFWLEHEGLDLSVIKGCVGISGVYSDQRLMETHIGRQLLFNSFNHREKYYDAFPIYNVDSLTPPHLLINGGHDISLKRHTYDYHFALLEKGVFSQVEYFSQRDHWNICREWSSGQSNHAVFQKIQNFIQESTDFWETNMGQDRTKQLQRFALESRQMM